MSSTTIFITGVSSGLGLSFATHAIKQGATVIGTIRSSTKASSALDQLTSLSSKFHHVALDVTDTARIAPVVRDAIAKYGPIDVLINNAGYSIMGPVEHITEKEARHQMETCYFGPLALIQAFLPHFRERRSGSIVNVTSVAGLTGLPSCGLYAASKFALEGTSESLAAELQPFGIRVIVVEPGAFRTEFLSSSNLLVAGSSVGTWDTDYQGENPANVVVNKLQSMAGKQPGDPEKAAHAIWDVIVSEGLAKSLEESGKDGKAMRVLLGSDSLGRMKMAIDMREKSLKDGESIAKSCDY